MKRHTAIDMKQEEFQRIGHALVDEVAKLLSDLPDRPVTTSATTPELRADIEGDRPLPTKGADAQALIRETVEKLVSGSLFNGHPRFWGYITAGAAPIGILGDFLASAINANLGSQTLAPIATEIERQTVRWIGELVGMPSSTGGVLVSGGNLANLTAFWAARTAKLGASVRHEGLTGQTQPRVYVSQATHTWVQKAADLAGMGTEAVRWIPTEPSQRMDLAALEAAIRTDRENGDLPFMVVGTAGTVGTGAIDPLRGIADLCARENLWFHVDGAYGAFAAALPDAHPDLGAMALADSVAVDPHKWLYAPLDVGCVLVQDPATLVDTYAYHPDYYRFDPETINYVDYGLENSRPFRALKVWLQLQHAGRDGTVAAIAEDCRLAHLLFDEIDRTPDLSAHSRNLSITTFRYVPADLAQSAETDPVTQAYLNDLNGALQDRIAATRQAFVSNAVVEDRYLLRACFVNFRTTEEDVVAFPAFVRALGREIDAELRSSRPALAVAV